MSFSIAFILILPLLIVSQTSAEVTYTKVGEIEEDSSYNPPYIGIVTTNLTDCFSPTNKFMCHLDNGRQIKYGNNYVWKTPKDKDNLSVIAWVMPNLHITNPVPQTDLKSYQKICIRGKDVSTRSSLYSLIGVYVQDYNTQKVYFNRPFNFSKKRMKNHCETYRLGDTKLDSLFIKLTIENSSSIIINKITLYQGGSGPSIIDEIAAHPFDTGTK